MASYPIGNYTPGLAIEDLSSSRQRFVVLTATGFEAVNAITDFAEGVLENDPESGQAAAVKAHGYALLEAAEAIAINDNIGPSLNGRGQTAVATQYVRGRALQVAAAAGDLFLVRLFDSAIVLS